MLAVLPAASSGMPASSYCCCLLPAAAICLRPLTLRYACRHGGPQRLMPLLTHSRHGYATAIRDSTARHCALFAVRYRLIRQSPQSQYVKCMAVPNGPMATAPATVVAISWQRQLPGAVAMLAAIATLLPPPLYA